MNPSRRIDASFLPISSRLTNPQREMAMTDATPKAADALPASAKPFQNIVVAADGTHTGTRAVELGTQLAIACSAKLAVIYVVDSFQGFAPQFAWGSRTYESEHIAHGRAFLDGIVEKIPAHLNTTPILRSGDPGTEIAKAAKEYGADLLIMGGPSHHRLGRLLFGSVDETLLDRVRCAILVIAPEVVAKEKEPENVSDDCD
jgi:nucleotide-binding universal stress UspA family protein